jgi:hypothetical protein
MKIVIRGHSTPCFARIVGKIPGIVDTSSPDTGTSVKGNFVDVVLMKLGLPRIM